MSKRLFKICLPHLNWITKFILILAIMVMSAVGALMIRLKKGPLDLDFAKAYIEEALSDPEKGYAFQIGKASLAWPEVAAPLLIDLDKVIVMEGKSYAFSVDDFSFSLSGLGLLQGKILPSQIIIDKPAIRLFDEEGKLNNFWQGGEGAEEKLEENKNIKPKKLRDNLRVILSQIADSDNDNEIKMFSALKKVKIKNAVIQDQNNNGLALLNLSLRKHDLGLEGDLKVNYPEKDGKQGYFRSDILYRRVEKDVTFTATLKDLHSSHVSPFIKDFDVLGQQNLLLNGDVKAAFGSKLKLQLATIKLDMPNGEFSIPDMYETPIALKEALLEVDFNRSQKKLEIKNFQTNIGDIPIEIKGVAHLEQGNIIAPIELKISSLPLDNIPPIFPKSHLESSAGQWLTQKLAKGRFYDVVLTTSFNISRDFETKKRDANMTNTKVQFKAEGVTIKYSDTLKPVTDVIAEGVYENDVLTVQGKQGTIGDVIGKNVKLAITDLSVEGGGKADINFDASGSLKSALDYVADEPLSVRDELGFDTKNVRGDVNFNVQLNFPTVKNLHKEEVKVTLKGKVSDIIFPDVVRGLSLTGGPYDLGFDDGAIMLKGQGMLGGRSIDLDWMQYLDSTGREYESKIIAKITADEYLRDKFGVGLKDYISGDLPVEVVYIDKGVKATIDVKGYLAPTVLHIDAFDYKKEAGVPGDLSFKAYLNGDDLKEVDKLNLNTKGFSLSGGRLIFKTLKDGTNDISKGNIAVAKIGKTELNVGFEVSNDNVLKAVAKGPVIDMTPFIKSDKKKKKQELKVEKEQIIHISAQASKMIGHEGEALNDGKIYLELDKVGAPTRIEMDAKLGAGSTMLVRFRPDETGVRRFRMESDNAGYVLKVFGLYDKMRSGNILVIGSPQQGSEIGNLFGTAEINNFKIVKAPALAKLISATSIKGVNGLLNNEGVVFSKLQSDFEWKFRDEGNLLVVKDGRTSGNSLGLTFEGLLNLGTDISDISGTVIPLSGMNNAVSQIPLIGTILTGGDALFAATYSMKGAANDPKITINPLSVLAPGFLRKIFFESDVDMKVKKEEKKK